MPDQIDDLRILSMKPLSTPEEIIAERPLAEAAAATVAAGRRAVHGVLHGHDDRLAVIVGPCSIHDPEAALDYARRLIAERQALLPDLEIIMRVYFEKPRTTVGWKGLINDPDLNDSFNINKGLRLARDLLAQINEMGLPAAVEFLDVVTPQYIADLVSWGAIGARTTESQIHREMASGLSCPVGFKNGTQGDVKIAVDAAYAASQPHHFLAIAKDGRTAIAATSGNPDAHVVLRGGKTPNYDAAGVAAASAEIAKSGLRQALIVDASHANSGKKPENQPAVLADIGRQLAAGEDRIAGVMIESHLVGGRQDLVPGKPLVYGQSITDGCLGWDETAKALHELAAAVRARRAIRASDGARQAVGA